MQRMQCVVSAVGQIKSLLQCVMKTAFIYTDIHHVNGYQPENIQWLADPDQRKLISQKRKPGKLVTRNNF